MDMFKTCSILIGNVFKMRVIFSVDMFKMCLSLPAVSTKDVTVFIIILKIEPWRQFIDVSTMSNESVEV